MFNSQAHYFLHVFIFLFIFETFVQSNPIEEIDNYDLLTAIEVLEPQTNHNFLIYGSNVTVLCKTKLLSSSMWWTFKENNVTQEDGYIVEREGENINKDSAEKQEISILHIINVNLSHVGNYKCHATNTTDLDFAQITFNVTLPVEIVEVSKLVKTKLHKDVQLYCLIIGYPLMGANWYKDNELLDAEQYKIHAVNQTCVNFTLHINQISKKDNGTYACKGKTFDSVGEESVEVLVLDKPQITIDVAKAIGTSKIYLNWTTNDGNEPDSLHYSLQYMEIYDTNWIYLHKPINGSSRSYVLREKTLKNGTNYTIRMQAINSEGESQFSVSPPVQTLLEDPEFIPDVKVTGVTVNSITISWTDPPQELTDYVHYYQLRSMNSTAATSETISHALSKNLYMFSNLRAATTYNFQVAACSEYSKECGLWSAKVNGTTMDGISGPVVDASVECRFENISHISFVFVNWKPPLKPHGKVTSYNVNLEGNASFINDQGILEHTTWGPKVNSISENSLSTRFYNVSANTNYTVRISAITRSKKYGDKVELYCMMPATVPDKQKLSRFTWGKMEEQGHWVFKLIMPRVSERNGPICCYRIYLVRMEAQQTLAELPTPEELEIVTYQQAHRTPKGGAYIAEMFTSSTFHPEVFLGDDKVYNLSSSLCDNCVGLRPYSNYKDHDHYLNKSAATNRVRRQYPLSDPFPPYDGTLDISSNYTGFVEIIVKGYDDNHVLAAYSNYLVMMNPGPEVVAAPVTGSIGIVVQILCGLVVVTLLLLTALCLLHQYTKQAHAQAVEMITFRTSLRLLCRDLRGRQRLVSLNPPDMCPITRTDLVSAYIERHRDSDYGFQQEFELLPDRFNDRTTRHSDTRENVYKNRYPDIKAYDQTRVKIAQVDGIAGSDYINANYVLGYKERKKFICAQGPMDTTVEDFWRLIWEQHLEMILMLTNLEEYSKTKCAKYWPDKTEGDKVYGEITVIHDQEKRYSDYIVRDLKICRKGAKETEERRITQFHYLVWKDFMAPEHPHGIIKFIKRINEAYSIEKGSILIHCSAGVGRTGTLVALDCLLQQLKEEGQAAIFNTICDLRHQRNFLVQSLKQYIFIYRALMEVAQYGDTEIPASELKSTIERLKRCEKEKTKSRMEDDFENIKNALEDRKSCSVASGEENREKNRCDSVIPYDRNRVILTPLSGKEHSTYINASFIEGYDNSESFIITQDPTESTIADFWRMVSEQGVSVIVMLSELGDGKCPRYWPENESVFEHITVRYVQAESCPYYTRRQVYVRNREGEDFSVTHLQYHGWPTVDGEVPEVTRGLIELVDFAQSAVSQHGSPTPMVVHCSLGSDRSSMFVGLSILVNQLQLEHRVDVFTITRKLRSQRQAMISTYGQYEFLHRAILNYAELHGLCET